MINEISRVQQGEGLTQEAATWGDQKTNLQSTTQKEGSQGNLKANEKDLSKKLQLCLLFPLTLRLLVLLSSIFRLYRFLRGWWWFYVENENLISSQIFILSRFPPRKNNFTYPHCDLFYPSSSEIYSLKLSCILHCKLIQLSLKLCPMG